MINPAERDTSNQAKGLAPYQADQERRQFFEVSEIFRPILEDIVARYAFDHKLQSPSALKFAAAMINQAFLDGVAYLHEEQRAHLDQGADQRKITMRARTAAVKEAVKLGLKYRDEAMSVTFKNITFLIQPVVEGSRVLVADELGVPRKDINDIREKFRVRSHIVSAAELTAFNELISRRRQLIELLSHHILVPLIGLEGQPPEIIRRTAQFLLPTPHEQAKLVRGFLVSKLLEAMGSEQQASPLFIQFEELQALIGFAPAIDAELNLRATHLEEVEKAPGVFEVIEVADLQNRKELYVNWLIEQLDETLSDELFADTTALLTLYLDQLLSVVRNWHRSVQYQSGEVHSAEYWERLSEFFVQLPLQSIEQGRLIETNPAHHAQAVENQQSHIWQYGVVMADSTGNEFLIPSIRDLLNARKWLRKRANVLTTEQLQVLSKVEAAIEAWQRNRNVVNNNPTRIARREESLEGFDLNALVEAEANLEPAGPTIRTVRQQRWKVRNLEFTLAKETRWKSILNGLEHADGEVLHRLLDVEERAVTERLDRVNLLIERRRQRLLFGAWLNFPIWVTYGQQYAEQVCQLPVEVAESQLSFIAIHLQSRNPELLPPVFEQSLQSPELITEFTAVYRKQHRVTRNMTALLGLLKQYAAAPTPAEKADLKRFIVPELLKSLGSRKAYLAEISEAEQRKARHESKLAAIHQLQQETDPNRIVRLIKTKYPKLIRRISDHDLAIMSLLPPELQAEIEAGMVETSGSEVEQLQHIVEATPYLDTRFRVYMPGTVEEIPAWLTNLREVFRQGSGVEHIELPAFTNLFDLLLANLDNQLIAWEVAPGTLFSKFLQAIGQRLNFIVAHRDLPGERQKFADLEALYQENRSKYAVATKLRRKINTMNEIEELRQELTTANSDLINKIKLLNLAIPVTESRN